MTENVITLLVGTLNYSPAADEAADEAANAPYNVLLVDARFSQR